MFRIFAAIIALVGAVGSVTYVKSTPQAVAQITHEDRAHAQKRPPVAAPPATTPTPRAERPKAKRPAKAKPKVKRERRRTDAPRERERPQQNNAWDSPFCRNARSQAAALPQAVRDRLTANATASQRRRYGPCFA